MSRSPDPDVAARKLVTQEPERDPWSKDGQTVVANTTDGQTAAGEHRPIESPVRSPSASHEQAKPQPVVVTGFAVPFGAMVAFGIKAVLAAVPALVLLMVVMAALFALAGTLLGGAIMTMFAGAWTQALSWIGWPW
ncbi:MAG: hypothetical protein AB8C46_12685 [Burkholderiaceae bacterium]